MSTMFDTILQLPLFQGLAQEDFTNILEKVKLSFTKHKVGEVICKTGDTCNRLIFVLKGEVSSTTPSTGLPYSVTEYPQGPFLIEPHSLFGMSTSYASTYKVLTEAHTISVDKFFVMSELLKYDIFRLNYINIVSNRTQNLHTRLWSQNVESLEKRIRFFILTHSEYPTGRKIIKIKMEVLAQMLNHTRAGVSRALNILQEKRLIELRRGEILIPEVAKLA